MKILCILLTIGKLGRCWKQTHDLTEMVQDTVQTFAFLVKVMYFACSQLLREGITPKSCKTGSRCSRMNFLFLFQSFHYITGHSKFILLFFVFPIHYLNILEWCSNFGHESSKFFIHQLMHKRIALKTILKFTLKQFRHVSVQSYRHQGVHYSCLLKLQLLKQSVKIHRGG